MPRMLLLCGIITHAASKISDKAFRAKVGKLHTIEESYLTY